MKWNDLSMTERAAYIRAGVNSGLTNLNDIHRAYYTYAKGGYLDWINRVKEWKPGISEDIDAEEPTYDYEGFFMEDPDRAWRMLDDDPEAHFIDKYKRPNHPTFSDESIYSTPDTPGGHWHENYGNSGRWVYEPSEYTKEHIDDTRKSLENSGEGYLDGSNVVFPKRHKYDDGGPKRIITTGNEYGDIAASFLPIVGTAMDWETAIREPSIGHFGTALASTILDAIGGSVIKGGVKAIKAVKAYDRAMRAEKAAKNLETGAERAYRAGKIKRGNRLMQDARRTRANNPMPESDIPSFMIKKRSDVIDYSPFIVGFGFQPAYNVMQKYIDNSLENNSNNKKTQ